MNPLLLAGVACWLVLLVVSAVLLLRDRRKVWATVWDKRAADPEPPQVPVRKPQKAPIPKQPDHAAMWPLDPEDAQEAARLAELCRRGYQPPPQVRRRVRPRNP